MRTLEQQRAAHALARVGELNKRYRDPGKFRERYRSYVDRLGPSIVMNGLGQALATERAAAGATPENDDEKAHHALYESLSAWLCRNEGGIYRASHDLLQELMEHDESSYLRAQAEALAWLEWHKKCCRAFLPKGEGRGNEPAAS